jgi:hypothetical protein
MKRYFKISSSLGVLLILAACGSDSVSNPGSNGPPTITGQPSSISVTVGETATFSVTATGAAPLAYQWRRGGAVIPGATGATFTTPAAVIGDSGAKFSVQVSNAADQVTSDEATLIVYKPGNLLATLLNFAETANRNWNYGGHTVDSRFTADYGRWDYTNTTYEPWLFDRPDVWRMLAEMTGDARWQTQANADLAYYESRLSAEGIFINKVGEDDTKYSYVHPWSANVAKQAAAFTATANDFPDKATLSGLWTERELWVALNAAVKYHSIAGDAASLKRAQAMVDQWDVVSAGRGAPLVTYTLHEGGGPGGTTPTDLVTSPWMSALYFQAARLYVQQVPDVAPQVYRQASDYFDWLNIPAHRGFYPGSDADVDFTGLVFPAYLAGGTLVGDASPSEGDMDHALDMAGFVAFAIKAKQALGLSTAAAQGRLSDMKLTTMANFDNFTRSTIYLPKYRVSPPRKFLWWARGMYELRANGGG